MSMSDCHGTIWMEREPVEWRDLKVHVLTHTLHNGCGSFEGALDYNEQGGRSIFRLPEHRARLFNSAKTSRTKVPFSFEPPALKVLLADIAHRAALLRLWAWLLSVAAPKTTNPAEAGFVTRARSRSGPATAATSEDTHHG